MSNVPQKDADCQGGWGDEIPVMGEVEPLEHLAPELEAAVLDTARQLLGLGQDATMVARRIHAALDGAVEAVTRPDSPMAWRGGKFYDRKRRANEGPGGNGDHRDRLDSVQEVVEAEEPGVFTHQFQYFEDKA